jgi:hypothetical protein
LQLQERGTDKNNNPNAEAAKTCLGIFFCRKTRINTVKKEVSLEKPC